MSEATKTPEAKKLLFTSPYLLLAFLIVPAVTIVSHLQHLPYPKNMLMLNNICLLLVVALRCGWYLCRVGADLRYGGDTGRPRTASELKLPVAALRKELAGAGYRFDASGGYGEKRDFGYLGTAILYGALTFTLLFGTWDNLRQFSCAVVTGVGAPVPVNQFQIFMKGPLVSLGKLPQVQVRRQIMPGQQWPDGATDIALLSADGKVLSSGFTAPGKPLHYGGFDYVMARFMFDTTVVVAQGRGVGIGGEVRLKPLPVKQGEYGYYGSIPNMEVSGIHGDAWYNPVKQYLKLILTLNGKPFFDDYLQTLTRTSVTRGDYTVKFQRLGQWSDIRVTNSRHFTLMKVGGVIALIGLLLRLLLRPQRVWLEEAGEGCRVWTVGRETKKVLKTED
jgi:hypothetical protein